MKKYIIPVTEIHEIELALPIAASLPRSEDGVDGGDALGKDDDGYWED